MMKPFWKLIVLCVAVLAIGLFLLKQSDDSDGRADSQAETVGLAEEKSDVQVEKSEEVPVKPVVTAHEDQPSPKAMASQAVCPPEDKAKPPRAIVPKVEMNTTVKTPPTLSVIMGEGQKNNYHVRIKAVHKLGKNLTPEEVQTLFALLNRKKGQDRLPFSRLNAVKNDVVNVLKKQKELPAYLAHNLMAMYYDTEHDNVWRDYCIQHLGGIYKKTDEKSEISKTIWNATSETKLGIAGTALIALSHNCDESNIKKADVAAKALELSTSSSCGELAKITALQICAKLGEKQVLPTARRIATSGGSVPLRMSAIAAVGTLGDESDREMLRRYAKSSDVRLRKSAQSALGRLRK